MGMPGSEIALEEIMSCVLGDFIQEGFITKIVDDLYMGFDSEDELVSHWLVVVGWYVRVGLAEWVTTSQPTPRCCNCLS